MDPNPPISPRPLQYRKDIDGLRALAVLSVILFHAGIRAFSGGYTGVDVFFVISGYLITSLVYKEIRAGSFTFQGFYKRRIVRLLPALSITLLLVLAFGFLFYDSTAFDNLGKQVLFSSLGAANILFSRGVNYFVNDPAFQPLLHLWSLGIEEQFYLALPLFLLLTQRFAPRRIPLLAGLLLVASFALSVYSVQAGWIEGYFLPHFRAFELLIGVLTALLLSQTDPAAVPERTRQALSILGLALILAPVILLDESSPFPGFNALWPCLGTALLIAFPNRGPVSQLLSRRELVLVGLISYPLYLLHLPIISAFDFFTLDLSPLATFALSLALAGPLSYLIYRTIEAPLRDAARRREGVRAWLAPTALLAALSILALLGKEVDSGAFDSRFQALNPYAVEVIEEQAFTFQAHFERGYQASAASHGQALFVGDSALQGYVLPLSLALGLDPDQVDTATRGGCVLLEGADFSDTIADIPCSDIKAALYQSTKTYDYLVISQAWDSYDDSIANFPEGAGTYQRWAPFLDATLAHFSGLADQVILIGGHPHISGTRALQPSILINPVSYQEGLQKLAVSNLESLEDARDFFGGYQARENILVIEPSWIFCSSPCTLHNGRWSYFRDNLHLSAASTDFVVARLRIMLEPN